MLNTTKQRSIRFTRVDHWIILICLGLFLMPSIGYSQDDSESDSEETPPLPAAAGKIKTQREAFKKIKSVKTDKAKLIRDTRPKIPADLPKVIPQPRLGPSDVLGPAKNAPFARPAPSTSEDSPGILAKI